MDQDSVPLAEAPVPFLIVEMQISNLHHRLSHLQKIAPPEMKREETQLFTHIYLQIQGCNHRPSF
jgi:hypothetical protein